MQNSGTSSAGQSTSATEIAERARQDATRLVTEAKQTGKSMIGEKQHAAADEIAGVANVLRQTAQSLEQNNQITTGRYAQRAAAGLDQLSSTLRERDIGSLFHQAESFARRSPALFFGGAVAVGFLMARFMKSTEHRADSDEHRAAPAGSSRSSGYSTSSMHDYATDYAEDEEPNRDVRGARARDDTAAGAANADSPGSPNTPLPRTDRDPATQVGALLSTDPASKSESYVSATDRQRTGGNHAS